MFNKMVLISTAIMVTSFTAHSQNTQPVEQPSTTTDTPAVSTPNSKNPNAAIPGSNSFTEDQAKERLVNEGYTNITGLKLTDEGIWVAEAMKNNAKITVSLDYQGNITAK